MFSPRIEVVLLIEECCFGVFVRDIFQHVLVMDLLKDGDDDVGLVGLVNMVESRPVIPPVAHLVELT